MALIRGERVRNGTGVTCAPVLDPSGQSNFVLSVGPSRVGSGRVGAGEEGQGLSWLDWGEGGSGWTVPGLALKFWWFFHPPQRDCCVGFPELQALCSRRCTRVCRCTGARRKTSLHTGIRTLQHEKTTQNLTTTSRQTLPHYRNYLEMLRAMFTCAASNPNYEAHSLRKLQPCEIRNATDPRTISPNGIVQFYSCNKAVVNVFSHKVEPSSATRTGQYLLGW